MDSQDQHHKNGASSEAVQHRIELEAKRKHKSFIAWLVTRNHDLSCKDQSDPDVNMSKQLTAFAVHREKKRGMFLQQAIAQNARLPSIVK